MGSEIILAPPGTDGFDLLSETGAVVWTLLEAPRTLGDLVGTLADLYRVPAEVIAPDIEQMLYDLLRLGSIEEIEETDG